jgi:hypothetical protein
VAPRDAQTPPLEDSFAALARQTLDAAHDHVPQCVLPPDDRKARMCQRPPLPPPPPPLPPPLPLPLRAAAAAAAASCCELLLFAGRRRSESARAGSEKSLQIIFPME